MSDIIIPDAINEILPFQDAYLSYTTSRDNNDMKDLAFELVKETYTCQVRGSEIFRIVSPIYRQNMYSQRRPELKPHQSPVNLFHEVGKNFVSFPLLNQTVIIEVDL